jgi:hypothetical protein
MTMPETSVYEDYLTARRKNEIGLPRQRLHMKAVAIPQAMRHPSNRHLRRRIPGTYRRHDLGTLLRIDVIGHAITFGSQEFMGRVYPSLSTTSAPPPSATAEASNHRNTCVPDHRILSARLSTINTRAKLRSASCPENTWDRTCKSAAAQGETHEHIQGHSLSQT